MAFPGAAQGLASLNHALDVLEALAAARGGAALADLAREVSISKSGLYRILSTLSARGYAAKTEDRSYRLGVRLWELGCRVRDVELVEVAAPFMQALTRASDETCQLGILVGFDVIYVHRVEAGRAVRVHTEIGSRIQAHCTSTGMALLASLPPDRLAEVLPTTLKGISRYTITDRAKLLAELACVRRRGYAIGRGYWREDVCGVAAVILGAGGEPVASLNIAAPRNRFTRERMLVLGDLTCRTARQISASLGFSRNDGSPEGAASPADRSSRAPGAPARRRAVGADARRREGQAPA
jgi:IclR family transcriptional regulator, KDG regulon repressor